MYSDKSLSEFKHLKLFRPIDPKGRFGNPIDQNISGHQKVNPGDD